MSITPVPPIKRDTTKCVIAAVVGAYVTTSYLNQSKLYLFAGGAATGYIVAKCGLYQPEYANALVTGAVAAYGTQIVGNLGFPVGNTLVIAAMSLALPYWLHGA